jgi:serralysin
MVDTTAPTLTTPTAISLTDTTVADTYSGQTGTLSATDPENATVTYGIEHGTVSGSTSELVGQYGALSLDTSTGAYTYTPNATAINALTSDTSESFTLTASDSGNNVGSETLTVSITGADDAPVLTSAASASASENVSASTTIYTAATTDADSLAAPTYALSGADASLFSIDASSGVVEFLASPDYEAPHDSGGDNVYDVIITADDGSNSTTQAVAITVVNINEISVDENTTGGVYVLPGYDPAAFTYTLGGVDATLFDIDQNTGEVIFSASNSAPDFEQPFAHPSGSGVNNVYNITVIATASDTTVTAEAVQISVTDVAEVTAPTVSITAPISGGYLNDSEDASALTIAGTSSGADGQSVTLTVGGVTYTATVASGGAWLLSVSASDLQALTEGTISLTADVSDAAGNAATQATGSYVYDITAPTFSSSASVNAVGYTTISTSTTVYSAIAYDNGGAAHTGITYSLGGNGVDNGLFDISTSGLVTFKSSTTTASPQDSGTNSIYDITVRATDAAGNSFDKAVQISVTDTINIYSDAALSNSLGKLIKPVTVDGGSTYYFWDRSGDGTANSADVTTHNALDAWFNHDVYGTVNSTSVNVDGNYGTTETYRYATLYTDSGAQIALALPTMNGVGSAAPYGLGNRQIGTSIGNGSNDANSTFSDLLAIWDAYNGTGTDYSAGLPTGWLQNAYWSSTEATDGHVRVSFNTAIPTSTIDTDSSNKYAAFQVLS